MSRTKKDTAGWAEAHRRRLADPLGHLREQTERAGLVWADLVGRCGEAELEWWWRNHQAILMLQEVERLGCMARAAILQGHIETLDDEALPGDFHKRLIVAARDAAMTADKAMAADRDAQVRHAWPALYSETVQRKYIHAIDDLAHYLDLSASEVKRGIENKNISDPKSIASDFARLTHKRAQVHKRDRK